MPSDVHARYERMKGNDVLMVFRHPDEHGTPILVEADEEGMSAQELANRYNRVIAKDLCDLGLSYDLFTRTTTGNHEHVVQEHVRTVLRQRLHLSKGTQQVAISPSTGRTLPDRYIEGTCPICRAEGARGDQCDACGNELDPDELHQPRTPRLTAKPRASSRPSTTSSTCRRSPKPITAWLETRKGWRTNVINFSLGLFKEVKPRAITRDIDWGIPVPVKGWIDNPNKKLYVWFDAVDRLPVGPPSSGPAATGDPEAVARMVERPELPGLRLHGQGQHHLPLPDLAVRNAGVQRPGLQGRRNRPAWVRSTCLSRSVASEFMTMEGKKFSSSRGIVIYVQGHPCPDHPVDAVRYYISAAGPEPSDSDSHVGRASCAADNEELACLVVATW